MTHATSQTVSLATSAGPMQCQLFLPKGDGPRGAVIVVPEVFGLMPAILETGEWLARAGYLALCIEIFHRTAPAGFVSEKHDFAAVGPHFKPLMNDGLAEDLAAARDFLAKQPRSNGKVGVLGYCVGGFAAYLGACRTKLAASVAYYGGGIVNARPQMTALAPLLAETVTCPVLAHFGADDASIPASDREAIDARLTQLGVAHEFITYAGAGHAFGNYERPSFNPIATAQAWAKTLAFLAPLLA